MWSTRAGEIFGYLVCHDGMLVANCTSVEAGVVDGIVRDIVSPKPHFCVLSLSASRSYFPTFALHISLLGAALLHDPEDQP